MGRGTLTTLDFVISVLCEHEKEMTMLSNKLEKFLGKPSGETVEKGIDEISHLLTEIKQHIRVVEQNTIESKVSSQELLGQLIEQITILHQNLSLLVNTIGNYPTKSEFTELKTSISSLHSLMKGAMGTGTLTEL